MYIGGPGFGARHNATNSVADIAGLCGFAHRYHARIFATLNTILHDNELEAARDLVWQLWDAGVDALIVQDMGLLQLDLPPIELHASTQCDIRTPEKARFLADVGFSQLVLARELGLKDIHAIHAAVDGQATLEYFIHGACAWRFPASAISATPRPGAAPTAATVRRPVACLTPSRTNPAGWWHSTSTCCR